MKMSEHEIARRRKHREFMEKKKFYRCRHFTGTANKVCEAGVEYETVVPLPCWGTLLHESGKTERAAECRRYEPFSRAELAEQEAEQDRVMKLHTAGKSHCCEADLVGLNGKKITTGHGHRFCGKCGHLCFMV